MARWSITNWRQVGTGDFGGIRQKYGLALGRALRGRTDAYSRARGKFAGISLEGSTLRPDDGANKNLYGQDTTAKDIVFNKSFSVPDSAKNLLATLRKSHRQKKRRLNRNEDQSQRTRCRNSTVSSSKVISRWHLVVPYSTFPGGSKWRVTD